jgi:2-polyprenyl-3-methyl-5-hydroxy-6-metoxy-1,4-benzoquinol methylase
LSEPTTTTEEVSFVARTDLTIQTLSDRRVEISYGDHFHKLPGIALSILDVFGTALTIDKGHELLETRLDHEGDRAWLYDTVSQMLQHGIIIPVPAETDRTTQITRGYAAPRIHVVMLRDEARTSGYINALRETIKPDDVVLDIGTGTGVLAVAAAEAGARKVYAIEANSETARYAKALIASSPYGDRIELINGWSTEVQLPERCDMLVSEMIGDDPLDEDILSMTADAIDRHLKPGARLIPDRLDIYAQPVRLPDGKHEVEFFCEQDISSWEKKYGLQFRSLLGTNPAHTMELVLPQETKKWKFGAPRQKLTSLDLTQCSKAVFDKQFVFELEDGSFNGMLVFFETTLSENQCLSTDPTVVDENNHWLSPCHMFRSAFSGQMKIGFRYGISEWLDGVYLSGSED